MRPCARCPALQQGSSSLLVLAGAPAMQAQRAPFRQPAVPEPAFDERCQVLIAMAPPLARTTLGKLPTHAVSGADQWQMAEGLTATLDPDRTQLRQQFRLGLAGALDTGGAQVLRVPVGPADSEPAVFAQAGLARAALQHGAAASDAKVARCPMA